MSDISIPCGCVGVETGDYSNTVILGYYPIMREYVKNRAETGLSRNGICVDGCIVDQVISLWEAGIKTYGSCCGHNTKQGFINVGKYFNDAVALGFEPYVFKDDKSRQDTVKTKPFTTSTRDTMQARIVELEGVLFDVLVEYKGLDGCKVLIEQCEEALKDR